MNSCNKIVDIIGRRLEDILDLRGQMEQKEDGSFVSEGDLLVQTIVFDYVRNELPEYKLISEEMAPFEDEDWDINGSYVVLDPIDGTENFISGLREWGVGISIYTLGVHQQSCIYLPELNEVQITGMPLHKYKSRIIGLSSSLTKYDMSTLPAGDFEYRIIGCSMYNTLSAVRGAFYMFENVKGVNCWDILPGLNLALEHNCIVTVDNEPYDGRILFPVKKYKISISNDLKL
ncbi:inositol monophosphatase [Candidatus Thioglobus sp.]|nr:inositol monophosphatase [Candidatus Thioglobus sp.]